MGGLAGHFEHNKTVEIVDINFISPLLKKMLLSLLVGVIHAS